MSNSLSDIQKNLQADNPEYDQSSSSQQTNMAKDKLNKKRKMIQKQLRQLMSKVDEYQLEKSKISKKETPKPQEKKKLNLPNKQQKQQFDQADIIKRRPITKQLLKEQRYQVKTSRNSNNKSNQRSNSSKQRELPAIDKAKLRSSEQKQRYINYLPDIDFRVPLPNKGNSNERKKEKLINYLEKAQQYEKDAIKKIGQIKRGKANLNYMEYIQVQNQVDSVYVNSLKARIECAMKM